MSLIHECSSRRETRDAREGEQGGTNPLDLDRRGEGAKSHKNSLEKGLLEISNIFINNNMKSCQ